MAYTVLARRYRSQTFDDVVGQDAVARYIQSEVGEDFALEVLPAGANIPALVYLVNQSDLEMAASLHYALIAALFVTLFLAAYLVLNIRQDPVVVVSERFRRFQHTLVRDYIHEGYAIDSDMWKREIDTRKEQIEQRLQKGIGRLSDEQKQKVDKRLSANWDELTRMVGSGRPQTTTAQLEPVSLAQIESIIQRTLEQYGQHVVYVPAASEASGEPPAAKPVSAGKGKKKPPKPPVSPKKEPVPVEEIEELDELEPEELDELELDELEPEEAADAEGGKHKVLILQRIYSGTYFT